MIRMLIITPFSQLWKALQKRQNQRSDYPYSTFYVIEVRVEVHEMAYSFGLMVTSRVFSAARYFFASALISLSVIER